MSLCKINVSEKLIYMDPELENYYYTRSVLKYYYTRQNC